MPKRFFSTELWEEDWFLEMPQEYKMFWFYMLAKCDHAGLFRVNFKRFEISTGFKIKGSEALIWFNSGKDRIRAVSDTLWLIEDFFVFQYGNTMNLASKVHESIYRAYNQANIKMTSIRGLKDLKDRVKDKDKEIKKGGVGENKKPDKAVKISENGKVAVFSDGFEQELGEGQLAMLEHGQLSPKSIVRGNSY